MLREHGAELLLHLGDVGTVEVIDELVPDPAAAGAHRASRLVFGNTDWDRENLGRYAQSLGIANDDPVGTLSLENGQELMFMHGDDEAAIARALAKPVRYLCHGHTHRASDQVRGFTRIINPGALFRARQYTVALLDTQSDGLTFYPVPEG